MRDILDRLREGLADAQARHAEVHKRWTAMQAEWQVSNALVVGYQKVIEEETRRQLEEAASTPKIEGPPTQAEQQAGQDSNKTQLVRKALAAHPGLTPAQVWGAVKGQIGKRTYVYSILKRLKDRDQIVVRRGKYYLPETPKITEGNEHQTLQ